MKRFKTVLLEENESVSPAGSHKPNTAVPQAYYNYKEGIKKMTTETGRKILADDQISESIHRLDGFPKAE